MNRPISLSVAALLWAGSILMAQVPDTTIMRAVAGLNGVFSPRGYFNITVRLYQLQGVEWAKYDMKKSRITLDFFPGVVVTEKQIQQVMTSAGYKPGPVDIRNLGVADASRIGPGWVKIKHPKSKNAVVRWFQLNF